MVSRRALLPPVSFDGSAYLSEIPSGVAFTDEAIIEQITGDLSANGYSIIPNALPPLITEGLLLRVLEFDSGQFKPAGTGRQSSRQLNPFMRRDRILWLNTAHPAESIFLDWMEKLRLALNRRLYLGLFDYECHFAHYPPGAFYKRHLDAFIGEANRLVTTVVYLNPGWTVADGGELLLYTAHGGEIHPRTLPVFGTLALFLSEEFPHAVAVAKRDRYSVAGWFRVPPERKPQQRAGEAVSQRPR